MVEKKTCIDDVNDAMLERHSGWRNIFGMYLHYLQKHIS